MKVKEFKEFLDCEEYLSEYYDFSYHNICMKNGYDNLCEKCYLDIPKKEKVTFNDLLAIRKNLIDFSRDIGRAEEEYYYRY